MPTQQTVSRLKNGGTSSVPPIHDSPPGNLLPTAGDSYPQVGLLRLLIKRAAELFRGKQTKDGGNTRGASEDR